jgi:hypothetical protein
VIEARYANHFEVGHNEYEFIFDFDQFHSERLGAAASESDASGSHHPDRDGTGIREVAARHA